MRRAYGDSASGLDGREWRTTYREAFMNKQTKDQLQKLGQARPSYSEEVNKQKQKAEKNEVAGRHKNDGQKDHKGAR